MDDALRSELDRLHDTLDAVDHYTLLGVQRGADRKAVKSAYYARASRFHPDRYFGKELGVYKQKLERIFGRMTIAHDTLVSETRRAEYDAYLEERNQLLELEKALVEPVEERPIAPTRVIASSTPPANPSQGGDDRARREALARRLLGGSSRRMPAVAPPPQTSSPPPRQSGVDTLITTARIAANTGDLLTASTRMRLAAKLDAKYATEAEELRQRAHAAMADGFVKQARFEEQEERWVAAALSWVKAHEGKPHDPAIAERAANALRQAKGDLHKAVKLAEQAAQARPTDAQYRRTLAEVYLAAGLLRRARTEVDHAMRLSRDPELQELSDELKRRGG